MIKLYIGIIEILAYYIAYGCGSSVNREPVRFRRLPGTSGLATPASLEANKTEIKMRLNGI